MNQTHTSPSAAPKAHQIIKRCGCGAPITRSQWLKLPFVGTSCAFDFPGVECTADFETRRCNCGSSICIPIPCFHRRVRR